MTETLQNYLWNLPYTTAVLSSAANSQTEFYTTLRTT